MVRNANLGEEMHQSRRADVAPEMFTQTVRYVLEGRIFIARS